MDHRQVREIEGLQTGRGNRQLTDWSEGQSSHRHVRGTDRSEFHPCLTRGYSPFTASSAEWKPNWRATSLLTNTWRQNIQKIETIERREAYDDVSRGSRGGCVHVLIVTTSPWGKSWYKGSLVFSISTETVILCCCGNELLYLSTCWIIFSCSSAFLPFNNHSIK